MNKMLIMINLWVGYETTCAYLWRDLLWAQTHTPTPHNPDTTITIFCINSQPAFRHILDQQLIAGLFLSPTIWLMRVVTQTNLRES